MLPIYSVHDGIKFVKNLMIPMRDGVHLAMDMHVPDGDGPFPLIFDYYPYRKDDQTTFTDPYDYYARHGFIGARIDCRGTGSSEGTNDDEYRVIEQEDGYDAIEWIASQEWCDGKIAMTGGSYGGFTSVQVAALNPPHLVTIIPVVFTDDRYTDDCHYRGGAWRCYYDLGAYGTSMIGMNSMPPYPEYSGDRWAELWQGQLEGNEPYLLTWMDNQKDGEYWRPGSVRGRYTDIKCSALMVGGWRDGYCNAPLRMSANMEADNKVWIGPWNHAGPDCITPGPSADFLHEVVRWCEYWLKGIDNGVMDEPKINIYVQSFDRPDADRTNTSGYWRTESEFPVPGTKTIRFTLGDGLNLDNTELSHGGGYEEYEYRPSVGIASGLWSAGVPFGLPNDQRMDEGYSVNYTSEPLESPVEIVGMPRAVLNVSSTAPVMAFVARLSDIAPDGTSAQATIGVLNGTRRNSLTEPEPMRAGEVYELNVDLDTTAWRFEKGHRIRLSISSADFPNLWPTPYKGTNRIHRADGHQSYLELPVVPTRNASENTMPSNEIEYKPASNPSKWYESPPDVAPWEIVQDMLRDRTGLRLRVDKESRPSTDIMISSSSELDVWVDNRDPANASGTGKHFRRITRSDSIINVDTSCSVRSTVDSFHVVIDLDVRVNGLPHHQRRWVKTFNRELL